ncbi:MAG TPA: glycosyltransferase family 2 protein [Candidatus Dormibacteraeota bacterium]|nr:glycosyltransferase family 2 protein [Candidatus Dormibacteraeota bacterium]
MIDVSICIATFRRPQGLLRLLRSLGRLDPASPRHEIIVADNDAARSGETAVRQARAEGLAAHYLVEPARGIAQARNRSVEPARGTFVAFIDDDEEADPQWLVQLCAELERHGADGAIGPVLPCFHDEAPRWLIEGSFFDRPRFPTGTVLDRRGFRTGNAIIRRRHLTALRGPFDERFALSGGEDTDLFTRLIANGSRIIAVDSAIVWEHLPPNRTTVRWVLRRRFLIGMGSARFYAAETPSPQRRGERARWLMLGLAWGVTGLLVFPASRAGGLTRMSLAARHFGIFAFHSGFTYRPYARDSWR